MEQEYSAGIIVYRKQNKELEYLLLHYTAGHWDFPKGHLEEGETKDRAALRELFEETGLTVTIDPGFEEQFGYYITAPDGSKRHKTVYFLSGLAQDTAVTLSHEHTDYVWLPYEKALATLTYGNAQRTLATLHKKLLPLLHHKRLLFI